ncbi:carbohydrate ABC transporter permease [Anaerocolumna sp. MB42-C2]|uniref:carbohydrate ABC transporter permease n=1 Tax=Anaerocolumna sp. MB42-C2 TaxID=3070997 RepID=UPI0027E0E265|nr:sugar ABC transporter permease [Anaerocolumna sp. MB42-C2]WMJ86259.1 sugar ABC transporter permease [Anaerocolumna sp. MB42-C2]
MIKISTLAKIRTEKAKTLNLQRKENLAGYAFILLNFFGYIAFKLIPLLFALGLSFSDWNFVSGLKNIKFAGISNYSKLFSDSVFITSLINTVIYGVVMVPIAIFLSLLFAVILNEYVFGKGLLRLAFYLPNVSSMVAVSVVWMILFLPSYGPINQFLSAIGFEKPPRWLNASSTSLLSIIIVGIWQRIGYNIIIFLAGLQGISKSLYESAEIDGANGIQKFFYITIPSLSNTMFLITMLSFISSFQVFTPVQVMTQGGPGNSSSVLVYYIYKTAFQYSDIGYASAMSWVLFFLVFIFCAGRILVSNRKKE